MGGRLRRRQLFAFGRPRLAAGGPAPHRSPGAGHRAPPSAAAYCFARWYAAPSPVPGKPPVSAPDAEPQPGPPFPLMCEWSSDLEVGWARLPLSPFRFAAVLARLRPAAAHGSDRFFHFFRHKRLALMGNLCRVGIEHIVADGLKDGIANLGGAVVVSQDTGDGNARPDGGAMIVDPHSAQLADDIHDYFRIRLGNSGLRHGDRDLRLAIQVSQAHRNQAIEQCVLGLVYPRVFFRVGGENGAKLRVNV